MPAILVLLAVLLAGANRPPAPGGEPTPARGDTAVTLSPEELARLGTELKPQCRARLETLAKAIRRYQRDRHKLPMWLSDLRKRGYVTDESLFRCPVTERTGQAPVLSLYFPDPQVPGSYLYEWNPTPIQVGQGPGDVLTLRAWKEKQFGLVGGKVPLVRCVLHGTVLNIGAKGDFFESELGWELGIEDPALRARLAPDFGAQAPPPGGAGQVKTWEGTAAPAFQLPALDGHKVTMKEHRGQVVVLDFWATWCGPCVQLFPMVHALETEFAGRPVVFYAVNLREPREKVEKFLADRGLALHVLLDADGQVGLSYGVEGIPRTVVVGKHGKIEAVQVGYSMDWPARMRGHLETALGKD